MCHVKGRFPPHIWSTTNPLIWSGGEGPSFCLVWNVKTGMRRPPTGTIPFFPPFNRVRRRKVNLQDKSPKRHLTRRTHRTEGVDGRGRCTFVVLRNFSVSSPHWTGTHSSPGLPWKQNIGDPGLLPYKYFCRRLLTLVEMETHGPARSLKHNSTSLNRWRRDFWKERIKYSVVLRQRRESLAEEHRRMFPVCLLHQVE